VNNHLRRIEAQALAIKTRQRQDLEDAAQLIAAPGIEVEFIREPWPVGQRGIVWAVFKEGADWFADVRFGDRLRAVPLSALATIGSQVDCATAQIRHKVAALKFKGSQFL